MDNFTADAFENATLDTDPLDTALNHLAFTNHSWGGGLSNHGPMAAEALESMGATEHIGPFITRYSALLEPGPAAEPVPEAEWRQFVSDTLDELADAVPVMAGHGLLRFGHAVRGLGRDETSVPRRRELRAAADYWRAGANGDELVPDLGEPAAGQEARGTLSAREWAESLPRLAPDYDRGGLFTRTIAAAHVHPDFVAAVHRLALDADPRATASALARQAASALVANEGIAAFALLHGVTAPTMVHQLIDFCSPETARRLELAAVGFVAAAIIGFDAGADWTGIGGLPPVTDPAELAERAAATYDDHVIKLTDACVRLLERTGDDAPLRAAQAYLVDNEAA